MNTLLKRPSLAKLVLAGLCLGLPGVAMAEYPGSSDSRPSTGEMPPPPPGPGDSSRSAGGVYDMAPAIARAAAAEAEYNRAYSDLMLSISRVRAEFQSSDAYHGAQHDLEESMSAYETARQPVLESVHQTAAYQDVMEKRHRVELALKAGKLPKEDVIDLASKKMEYSAQATRMEAEALQRDTPFQQARDRMLAAQRKLADVTARFEASVYNHPLVATAKQNYDSATVNRAGAEGYLAGAWISRNDTVDADVRRYSGLIVNYGAYWNGYYGVGLNSYPRY